MKWRISRRSSAVDMTPIAKKLLDASPVLNRMADRADRIDTNQNGDAAARLFDVLPIFVAMQTIGSSADRAFSESALVARLSFSQRHGPRPTTLHRRF
jgi:hypothetical protein